MIVRQEFHHLPPKLLMMQVLDNTSKVYVFLWDRRDEENKVDLTWKETNFLWNKNMFKNSLRKLNNVGLLSYNEKEDGLSIELVGWDELD